MKNYFKVVENQNNNCTYGLLIVEGEDISEKEVQNAIYAIKNSMDSDLASSYTIEDDIIPNLPFDCEFVEIGEVNV